MARHEEADIETTDGVADAVVVRPDGEGPFPGVLLFMDAFGVRDRLAEMAQRIADEGYVVLVPNVFYRAGRAPLLDDLDRLLRPENREELFGQLRPHMTALTPDRAVSDAEAYLRWFDQDSQVAAGPIGTTGYCMGGALALRTAAAFPDRVAAVGSFHGGNLATDADDSPHRQLGSVQAELYIAHADHDHSMPPEQQERLASALADSGVRHTVELYEGATHGFTMSDTAAYDEAATERHWTNLLALLDRNLER